MGSQELDTTEWVNTSLSGKRRPGGQGWGRGWSGWPGTGARGTAVEGPAGLRRAPREPLSPALRTRCSGPAPTPSRAPVAGVACLVSLSVLSGAGRVVLESLMEKNSGDHVRFVG